MREVRWGIIGCGDVTEVKSGPALQEAEGSRLVAVMRRNGKLAQEYAHRHHVPNWFDRAEDLIHCPDVNAIYVATPPSSHMEYTLAAATAGKPVYVEKPMGMNHEECQKMISACDEASVALFVAYYRRALPRFLKVKALLDEGVIGAVRFAAVQYFRPPSANDVPGTDNWRIDPVIAGGGYFHDLASHSIDLLQYLLGKAVSADGHALNQAGRYRSPDLVSGIMHLESGVQVVFTWAFNAYKKFDQTDIVGEQGAIRFSTFEEAPVVLETRSGREEFHLAYPVHIQKPLIQTVVNELLNKGTCPSTGRTAAVTNWVMDQMVVHA